MAHTDRDRTLPALSKSDRAHMRAERKRQRRRDRHTLRTTLNWDDYTHPRHPFDPYTLPSW